MRNLSFTRMKRMDVLHFLAFSRRSISIPLSVDRLSAAFSDRESLHSRQWARQTDSTDSQVMTLGDFSTQADSYRRSRPTYPKTLVNLLVEDAKVVAGDPVAELGAGTGIFTRLLVEQGFRVTAIEPNAEMRSKSDVPEAHWLDGTFESSGLAHASQRWAVAAQAFHWADPQRSLPEMRRILQPGCLFTVLWNNRANRESEILSWTEAAIRRHVPDHDEAYRDRPWQTILKSTGDFTFVNHRVVAHEVRMSKERYLDLWRSNNRMNTLAGPERLAAFLHDVREYLEQRHIQELDVPYRCEAWSARRRKEES